MSSLGSKVTRRARDDLNGWKLRALRAEAVLAELKREIYGPPGAWDSDFEAVTERTIPAADLINILDDTRIDEDLWLDADGEPTRNFDEAVTGAEHLRRVGTMIVNTDPAGKLPG